MMDMYTLLKMDNQQGSTVQHRKLCSTLCGSLYGRGVWWENGYMCLHGWVPLLSTWNHHNTVSSLSVQFSSVTQSCPTLCDPIPARQASLSITNSQSSPRLNVHRVSDAIQPSHPLSSPSPPAPNPSQHQSPFQWVNSSHEVAKVLEFQL